VSGSKVSGSKVQPTRLDGAALSWPENEKFTAANMKRLFAENCHKTKGTVIGCLQRSLGNKERTTQSSRTKANFLVSEKAKQKKGQQNTNARKQQ
jgi:hypothetical protein